MEVAASHWMSPVFLEDIHTSHHTPAHKSLCMQLLGVSCILPSPYLLPLEGKEAAHSNRDVEVSFQQMRPLDPLLPSRWEILPPTLLPSQLGTPLHPLLPSRRGTPLHSALRVPSLSIQRTSSLANQVLLSMPDGYRLLSEMTYCAPNAIQSLPSPLPHPLIGLVTNRAL